MAEFASLTGRRYERAMGYRLEDAEYVLAGQGSVITNAELVADHLREKGMKVGVLNLTMFRPFPADVVSDLLRGEGRHRARAHRSAAGRGPAAAARDPRRALAGAGERPRRSTHERRGKVGAISPSPGSRSSRRTRCRTSTPAASASARATCSRAT
jgi:hypothetical protein